MWAARASSPSPERELTAEHGYYYGGVNLHAPKQQLAQTIGIDGEVLLGGCVCASCCSDKL
jgi:hypothetical protein